MTQAAIPGTTAAIILAAGRSSRMRPGYHKLLLPLAGQPVLAHVLGSVKASLARPIILVLGYQADEIQQQLALELANIPDLQIIHNPDYQQGMSSSLRLGIQALSNHDYTNTITQTRLDGAVIILGDQPLLTTEIIDRVIQTHREKQATIVTPLYNGKRGQPSLFSADLFPELLQVSGDEGGKSVISSHKNALTTVELGDAMVNYDVDTWEAYQQLLAHWEATHQTDTSDARSTPEASDTKDTARLRHIEEARERQEYVQMPSEKELELATFWLNYSHQLATAIRYADALSAVERAIKLDPERAEAWYVKGTILNMQARYQEALEAIDHSLQLQPDNAAAWDGKAWILGIMGRRAEALEAVNTALKLDPDHFEALKRKKRLEY